MCMLCVCVCMRGEAERWRWWYCLHTLARIHTNTHTHLSRHHVGQRLRAVLQDLEHHLAIELHCVSVGVRT